MPYPEVEQVRKDVCYFLYEQANYSFLCDDIDWAFFKLPYWEYLDDPDAGEGEARQLLRNGCLAIILAGATAAAGNFGGWGEPGLLSCRERLEACRPSDEGGARLAELARSALALALTPNARRDFAALQDLDMQWPHDFVVKGYFRRIAGSWALRRVT
jgi:hypothetical protein